MAITFAELQAIVKKSGLKFFVDLDKPHLMFGATGPNGSYQCVICLELEGRFVQIRSLRYLFCPADHPHLLEVLKVIGAVNFKNRLVKFGWDPSDGEIVAYADLWLMDNNLTQDQWERIQENYLSVLDLTYRRLKQALDTGTDPGEEDPEAMITRLLGEHGLPGALRGLLERIRKKLTGPEEEKEEEITSI